MHIQFDLLIVHEPMRLDPYVVRAPQGEASNGDLVTFDVGQHQLRGRVTDIVSCTQDGDYHRCIQRVAKIYPAREIFRRVWEHPPEQSG